MNILAIDPGNEHSAWVVYDPKDERLIQFGISDNEELRCNLLTCEPPFKTTDVEVIEMVASYGMSVGREVFETVFWIGRLFETIERTNGHRPQRMFRMEVKQHLCHDSRAKDSNIRQALLDRFGPGREKAIGTKAAPGPLYGVSNDVWQALALAVTFADNHVEAVGRE